MRATNLTEVRWKRFGVLLGIAMKMATPQVVTAAQTMRGEKIEPLPVLTTSSNSASGSQQ